MDTTRVKEESACDNNEAERSNNEEKGPETDREATSCKVEIQSGSYAMWFPEDVTLHEIFHENGARQHLQETNKVGAVRKHGKKGDTRLAREGRKEARNRGKEYKTLTGKTVREKVMEPLGMCRMKCVERLPDECRKKIHRDYWSMGSFDKRILYISGLIEVQDKASTRIRTVDPDKHRFRQVTIKYHININGKQEPACKTCFMKTFSETKAFIETVIHKKRSKISGIDLLHEDMRGKHEPVTKLPEHKIEAARNHILSVPTYESCYTRKKSEKTYLPSHISLSDLYKEYTKKFPEDHVSRRIYESLFHELDIAIKKPKAGTCVTCNKIQMRIKMSKYEEKIRLQKEWEEHFKKAELAYDQKKIDKEVCQQNSDIKTIDFDLQQCLPTPVVSSSIAFYKRQLWTYNFIVHDCTSQQAECFLWHEGQAARGANEIASCLYKYLINLRPNIKHINMYSDSCQDQNKNSHMVVMCMIALQDNPNLLSINHKFLIPGHTHMECDSDHSLIEKKKKKYALPISHPHDWAQLVRVTGNKMPFLVTEMLTADFFEFSSFLNQDLILRESDMKGEKIFWKDIQWLHFEKGNLGTFNFKTSLENDEPFRTVSFRRRGRQMEKLVLKASYDGPNPIAVEKKKDLLDLLPFISETFWEFYRGLKTSPGVRNILPDAVEDEDDE